MFFFLQSGLSKQECLLRLKTCWGTCLLLFQNGDGIVMSFSENTQTAKKNTSVLEWLYELWQGCSQDFRNIRVLAEGGYIDYSINLCILMDLESKNSHLDNNQCQLIDGNWTRIQHKISHIPTFHIPQIRGCIKLLKRCRGLICIQIKYTNT